MDGAGAMTVIDTTSMAEMTLDELAVALAPLIADMAAFDGWSDVALVSAAEMAGVDLAVARLAYPGGAIDMIGGWIASIDVAMQAAFPAETLAAMKVRERIRALVLFRLQAAGHQREALRRAIAVQALPQNAARSLKAGWNSADLMWRMAGDTATDYNYYTKRTTLLAVYGSTLAVFVNDDSDEQAETRAFLDRRLDGVMRFEKIKAQLLRPRERFDPVRFLGRLRYPAR
ncbi:COQ9 family protein [Croceibacterium sp. TMG7-5b_MA50]|uniref:COQ9 family protein n=1 Tax=Croceibacterium sp. TMG7-5b_MA50 TaxID=3121290 RepID=UPI0032221CC0